MSVGDLDNLNSSQQEALGKLMTSLSDVTLPERDERYFLRWLRAVKFDVHKAEDRLRKHAELRKELGADTILTDWTPPEVLTKYAPTGLFGEDRDGHPVYYDGFGNLDMKGLFKSCKQDDLRKLKIMHAELCIAKMKEFSAKKGKRIETLTCVVDLENLSLQRHYYWPGIKLVMLTAQHYPGIENHIIFIKAPRVFPFAFGIVKHLIDETKQSKFVLLGANWREEILQYISPEQLPQVYGGTRCEPDPACSNFINMGGDVPPEYYLTNSTQTNKEDMERLVVSRGSSHNLEFPVEIPGTSIRWELITIDHDIGFGWFQKFEAAANDLSELIPVKRTNSHVVPERGVLQCSSPGIYVMKFDNSYSWTRSKEVYYSVKMDPPDSEPRGQEV
ncbi:hypothetical protein EMCRGX_G023244 [Ephydatia muelleri]